MKKMKKIKIFLGSSITEFERERNDIELFIRNVSDDFEDRYNIKILPLRCENMDNHVRPEGTQNAINRMVEDCDMALFIFFTKVGEFTEQEFNVAFEKLKNDGKPKIYVYFKKIEEGITVENSIKEFMQKIDDELGHYHGEFSHIDTVKLRILLNLKIQEMDFVSVDIKDGKFYIDGKKSNINIQNVVEFANNNDLKQLKENLFKIETEYYDLKAKYVREDCDEQTCRKYCNIASKRQNLIDSIEELQKLIFDMSLRMCKDSTYGEITQRQKQAYQLFEKGDLEGANNILDFNEIKNDYQHRKEQRANEQKKDAQIYIREIVTKIDILKTITKLPTRFEEIENLYKEIIKEAEEYNVELDVLYDCARYLYSQNNFTKAIEIAEKLQELWNDTNTTPDKLGMLHNLLGLLYRDTNRYDEAEVLYKEALEKYRKLAENNPDAYLPKVATVCNNLGALYNDTNRYDEAEVLYKEALEKYRKLAESNPDAYLPDVALLCNNLGLLYNDTNRYVEAEALYKEALEKYRKLAKNSPDAYMPYVALLCNNLGSLYHSKGVKYYNCAEKLLKEALEKYRQLAESNPDAYLPKVATVCNNLGGLYVDLHNSKQAQKYYDEALQIALQFKDDPLCRQIVEILGEK